MKTIVFLYQSCLKTLLQPKPLFSVRIYHGLYPVKNYYGANVWKNPTTLSVDKNQLYRCLKRVIKNDYRQTVSQRCFDYGAIDGLRLVLYDVTTLYFEVQKEDEYRRPGLSKERRLEPQIVIGLLVNESGFPLGITSFEGNTAETKTMIPVIDNFCRKHALQEITVVADAAMLSAGNLTALEGAGHKCIVGSRLTKIPYDIADYQIHNTLTDGQLSKLLIKTIGSPINTEKSVRHLIDKISKNKSIKPQE